MENNFFDFMLDAQADVNLLHEFLATKTESELTAFFSDNKYAVAPADVTKLLAVKAGAMGLSVTDKSLVSPMY